MGILCQLVVRCYGSGSIEICKFMQLFAVNVVDVKNHDQITAGRSLMDGIPLCTDSDLTPSGTTFLSSP